MEQKTPHLMELVRDYIKQYYKDRGIPYDLSITPIPLLGDLDRFVFYFNGRRVGTLYDKTWITEEWTWPSISNTRSIISADPKFFNCVIEDCNRVIKAEEERVRLYTDPMIDAI